MDFHHKSVQKDALRIKEICRQNEIDHVVVGLPLELDGNEGRSARLARQIGTATVEHTQLPVSYQDERYSTVEAEARLLKAGKNSMSIKKIIGNFSCIL